MTKKYYQFDRIIATFKPKNKDTLKPDMKELVGFKSEWQCIWEIEEGPYKNQMAWNVYDPEESGEFNHRWVPTEDLEIHELVRKSWRR